MAIQIETPANHVSPWPVVLQYGFRPFFLLAALQAAIVIPIWMAVWLFDVRIELAPDPLLWHGHAMIFGFAPAALAGFLLTAVPNWTGQGPVRHMRLAILVGLWLAARILSLSPVAVTGGAFALADLSFWVALAAFVAPGILRRNAKRNGVFVVILAVLFTLNLVWQLEALGWRDTGGRWAIHAAIGLFTLLVAIIGGRIVPAFTIGGMRMAGRPVTIEPWVRLDIAAIATLALAVLADAAGANDTALAFLFAAAACVHLVRLARWQGWRSLAVPLVWSLHAGYAWLVVGLALKALAALAIVPVAAPLHALGAGCLGTMILAVMSRAALGHTGRVLEAPPSAVIAYALVTIGAAARVASVFMEGDAAFMLLIAGGVAWAGGFLAYAIGYGAILTGPRPDGRPG